MPHPRVSRRHFFFGSLPIALHVPGKLEWDARNLQFTNSPEANRFARPVFRKGFELKV